MNAFPTRRLSARPDLQQLKRQAKELLDAYRAGGSSALAEVNRFYRDANPATFALHDAQLVLARNYGYGSWPKLKAYVDGVTAMRLMEEVRANRIEGVRQILRIRPELVHFEEPGTHGHTALHYAVLHRMPEMARALMRLGANPHASVYPRRDATTPLIMAVERGDEELAAILRHEEGRPAAPDAAMDVFEALRRGDEDRAIALLEEHPGLVEYRPVQTGRGFLHLAAARLLPAVVRWLLDHGAGANTRDSDGLTPLDAAGTLNPNTPAAIEVTRMLTAPGAAMSARAAVLHGDVELLRRLHAEGDIVTPRDDEGWLLAAAVDADQPGLLQLLLDFGLDPDARVRVTGEEEPVYTWGMPLYHCTRHGKYAMAQTLLERGADPNGQVYASGTPLSEAFGQRDEAMIALLERHGGQPNPSMAGLYRRPDLARKLLDQYGNTPLPDDGFGQGPVAEQLLQAAARGGDLDTFHLALPLAGIPDGDPRWNRMLLAPLGFWNHGGGPWCHHEWDRTGYIEIFRLILERSGPPDAALRNGATILHEIVTAANHVTAAERVRLATGALDAGARLDLRDDLLQSTPLAWACRWGRAELVELYLSRGADPVEREAEAWARPLEWARKKGRTEIVAMLRR